jgi:hypothetical protein
MANTLRFKRGLASGIPTALAGEPLFTTDTFDLYIGNGTTNTRFQKYIASGATTQILRGDGSLYTFPLAISSPSNGQVLKYNGTSWVNDSDSGITGSLTTNYLPKATGATTLGNSLVFDNGTNVGIGTASPNSFAGKVVVNGGISILNGDYLFLWSSGNSFAPSIYAPGNAIAFRDNNGTESMRITSLNNLHIGTFSSDSGEKLQVTGTMKVTGASSFGGLVTVNSSATTLLQLTSTGAAAFMGMGDSSGSFTYLGSDNGAMLFQTPASSYSTKMTLDNAGNIGLSVTPSAFNYAGNLQTVDGGTIGSIGQYIHFVTNAYFDGSWKYRQSTVSARYSQEVGSHIWYNAPLGSAGGNITFTQAMTLDASGNLGVGTASPNRRLRVASDGSNWISGVFAGSGGADVVVIGNLNGASIGGHNSALNSWAQLAINPDGGNVLIGQSSPNNVLIGTSSDSGEKLQVNGTGRFTDNLAITGSSKQVRLEDSSFVNFTNSGNTIQRAYIQHDGSNLNIASSVGSITLINALSGTSATFSSSVTAKGTLTIGDAGVTNAIINSADGMYFNIDSDASGSTPEFMFGKGRSGAGAGGTTFMTITNAGNVGIGTATPIRTLHVNGGNGVRVGGFGVRNSVQSANSGFIQVGSSDNLYGMLDFNAYDSNTIFEVSNTNPHNNAELRLGGGFVTFRTGSTPTEAARITPLQNLHIGTFSADSGEKLQVNGTAKITGATTVNAAFRVDNNGYVQIVNNANAGLYLNNGSTQWQVYNNTSNNLIFNNGAGNTVLTLAYGGAATFSSSVTAATGFFGGALGVANQRVANFKNTNGNGYIEIQGSGSAAAQILSTANGDFYVATGGTAGTYGTTRLLIDNTGAATFYGNLTVDTNTLFVDATNNRVGVLTTTPSEPLHVAGNMLISGANSFKMRNLAGTDVNVIRAVSGGTSVLSTATLGNNIAMGTQSAHDFLLCSSDTERIRLSSNGWFSHTNATNPSSSVTDSYVQYSADVTAGNAAPHFRTENGAVIKLYQETTAVGNSTISVGGGNAVLDDTEFGGYTLRQVVKALQNQGILA